MSENNGNKSFEELSKKIDFLESVVNKLVLKAQAESNTVEVNTEPIQMSEINVSNISVSVLNDIDFTGYVLKNRLKEILKERRIQQKEIAEKLNITTATASNIINNKFATSIELGFQISMILGLSFTDIFYYEKDMD